MISYIHNISLVGIYLFKVNNGNTRTICEICLKLTKKNPEPRTQNDFEQTSHFVLVFSLLTLNR